MNYAEFFIWSLLYDKIWQRWERWVWAEHLNLIVEKLQKKHAMYE